MILYRMKNDSKGIFDLIEKLGLGPNHSFNHQSKITKDVVVNGTIKMSV